MIPLGKTNNERLETEWILERIEPGVPFLLGKVKSKYCNERRRLAMLLSRIKTDRGWSIKSRVIGNQFMIIRE